MHLSFSLLLPLSLLTLATASPDQSYNSNPSYNTNSNPSYAYGPPRSTYIQPSGFFEQELCREQSTPDHWHLPYPGDCSKFIKCGHENGKLVSSKVYTCDAQLQFDPAKQVCDWARNVGCTPGAGRSAMRWGHRYGYGYGM